VDTSFQCNDNGGYSRVENGCLVQIKERESEIQRKFPIGILYADTEWLALEYEEYKDHTFANLPLGNYMVDSLYLGGDQKAYCIFKKVRGLFGRTHLCAIAFRYEDGDYIINPRYMEKIVPFIKECTSKNQSSTYLDKRSKKVRSWMEKVTGVRWAKECEAYVTNRHLKCVSCLEGFDDESEVVPCDKHGLFHLQCYLKVQKEGRKGCPACTAPGLHIAQDCDRYEVDLECPVCQETLTPTSEVVQCPKEGTVGGHLAHMGCYLQWENVGNNTCPKCRGPITTPASWRTRWSRFWNSLWTSGGKKVETEQLQTANKNSIA